MAVKIQIRNDKADIWQVVNPILAEGELAIEIDTRKFKIGDGVTAWNALPAATQGETGKSIEIDWTFILKYSSCSDCIRCILNQLS